MLKCLEASLKLTGFAGVNCPSRNQLISPTLGMNISQSRLDVMDRKLNLNVEPSFVFCFPLMKVLTCISSFIKCVTREECILSLDQEDVHPVENQSGMWEGVDQKIMIFITAERNQGLTIPLSFTRDQGI